MHSSMQLDPAGSLDGGVLPAPITLSQSLPWVPPESDDFDLFSSGPGMDTTFHNQSIAEPSPKSHFQMEDIRPSGAQADSEFFKQTEPTQLDNGINTFVPALNGISPFNHLAHRDSGYGVLGKSPNSCISELPVRQTQAGFRTASPDDLHAGQRTTSCPELDQ